MQDPKQARTSSPIQRELQLTTGSQLITGWISHDDVQQKGIHSLAYILLRGWRYVQTRSSARSSARPASMMTHAGYLSPSLVS